MGGQAHPERGSFWDAYHQAVVESEHLAVWSAEELGACLPLGQPCWILAFTGPRPQRLREPQGHWWAQGRHWSDRLRGESRGPQGLTLAHPPASDTLQAVELQLKGPGAFSRLSLSGTLATHRSQGGTETIAGGWQWGTTHQGPDFYGLPETLRLKHSCAPMGGGGHTHAGSHTLPPQGAPQKNHKHPMRALRPFISSFNS